MTRTLIPSTLLAILLAVPAGAEYLSFDQSTDFGAVKWIALVVVVLVVVFVGRVRR